MSADIFIDLKSMNEIFFTEKLIINDFKFFYFIIPAQYLFKKLCIATCNCTL